MIYEGTTALLHGRRTFQLETNMTPNIPRSVADFIEWQHFAWMAGVG
jgi:hypothetical protein